MNADTLYSILEQDKPTLVEFYEAGQTRSEETTPVVEQLRSELDNRANIVRIQCDDPANKPLAHKYHLHAYPTWVLFVDGEEAWRTTGRLPLSELKDMLHRFE